MLIGFDGSKTHTHNPEDAYVMKPHLSQNPEVIDLMEPHTNNNLEVGHVHTHTHMHYDFGPSGAADPERVEDEGPRSAGGHGGTHNTGKGSSSYI